MCRYILKRLLISLPVLFLISVGAFLLVHLTPGDPVDMYISPEMTQAQMDLTRSILGLDKPLFIQYFDWMKNLLGGNLGFSFSSRQPVSEIIGQRFSPTLILMSVSLLVAYLSAIPLGIIAALNKNSWIDRTIIGWTFINVSFPPFFLGLALIYLFAIKLDLLPTGGMLVLGQDNTGRSILQFSKYHILWFCGFYKLLRKFMNISSIRKILHIDKLSGVAANFL